MPLARIVERTIGRGERLPAWIRYGASLGMVAVAFGARWAASGLLDPGALAFIGFFPPIFVAAALFRNGAGYVAAAASTLASTYFLAPYGRFAVHTPQAAVSLTVFAASAVFAAAVIETLANALRRERKAMAARDEAERAQKLLLEEFRHRTRNDLSSLSALLLLRARSATPDARAALREAAAHARSLALVQTKLAAASRAGAAAAIDTARFLRALCADLHAGSAGDGLRPVAFVVEAEAHTLSSERAIPLGLVLNEAVTNALKYAFPEDRAGQVRVSFAAEGEEFVLTVADDGIGMAPAAGPPGDGQGLGTRLLRALAAQLRGTFARCPGPRGGTTCTLRFPRAEPGA